jgi:hypothetical protein
MAIATEPVYIPSAMKNYCSGKCLQREETSIKVSDISPYLPAPVGAPTRPPRIVATVKGKVLVSGKDAIGEGIFFFF